MADAAAAGDLKMSGVKETDAQYIADTSVVFYHSLVGLEGGYVDDWADGSADVFFGVVIGGDTHANAASAADGAYTGATDSTHPLGLPRARVAIGARLMHLDSVGDTPTQAKVGDLVYSADSDPASITLDSTGRTHPIGYLAEFRSATDVDVQLFTPSEMLAQATA